MIVNIIAHHIQSCHTVSQLKTETTQKAIQFATQTSQFALSLSFSSMSNGTLVESAIIRIFQTTTQIIITNERIRRFILASLLKASVL
jgi:hypothetical protein